MAQTSDAVQAVLGTSPMNARILISIETNPADSNQRYYAIGNADAPGRGVWVTTAAAGSAATQAAAILTTLRA